MSGIERVLPVQAFQNVAKWIRLDSPLQAAAAIGRVCVLPISA
jgi:hypothetical protein